MSSRPFLQIGLAKRVSTFAAAALMVSAVVFLFAPLSSSQQYPPPSWSVQSTDPTHSLLTLRGTVRLGVDTGMFYVVQFRVQGSGANQLASFQPGMSVTLESSPSSLPNLAAPSTTTGGKAQRQSAVVGKSTTAATAFTSIPTVDQTLVIQASGIAPIEGVVASVTGPQSYTVGLPGQACCAVTAFNSQTGIATAKVNTSGQIFMFQAPQATPHEGPPPQSPSYQHINVGQPAWANLTTGQVSLDGRTVCCQITAEGFSSSGPAGKPTPLGAKPAVSASQACCAITALNQQAKTASAKVKSNGQTFQVAVTDSMLFESLRVGQPIWANFKTRQVSINGRTSCCNIVASGMPPPAMPQGARPQGPIDVTGGAQILSAYRTSLLDPSAQAASRAEILRQVRRHHPIALVNGYWVTPIDMRRIYRLNPIQQRMVASLVGSPDAAEFQALLLKGTGPAAFGLVFTPNVVVGALGLIGAQQALAYLEANLAKGLIQEALGAVGLPFDPSQIGTDAIGVDDVILAIGAAIAVEVAKDVWDSYFSDDANQGQETQGQVDPSTQYCEIPGCRDDDYANGTQDPWQDTGIYDPPVLPDGTHFIGLSPAAAFGVVQRVTLGALAFLRASGQTQVQALGPARVTAGTGSPSAGASIRVFAAFPPPVTP